MVIIDNLVTKDHTYRKPKELISFDSIVKRMDFEQSRAARSTDRS